MTDPPQNNPPPPQNNVNEAGAHGQNITSNVRPPKPLIFDSNMEVRWKEWIQQFNWYAIATQLSTKPNAVQAATLMASMGLDAAAIFNTFNLSEAEQENITIIKERFTAYFTPRMNQTYERYLLNKMSQDEGEPFDSFATRVKTQIKKCNFGDLADSMLVDKFIIGVNNEDLRKKLLAEDNPTVDKLTKICQINEQTAQQLNSIANSKTVNAVRVKSKSSSDKKSSQKSEDDFDCRRCGSTHGRKNCPAYKKECGSCGIPGHLASVCRSKTKAKNKVQTVTTHQESEDEADDLYLSEITEEVSIVELKTTKNEDNWYEAAEIGSQKLRLKLDTGAQCNVLPEKYIRNANIELRKSKVKRLISYSDHRIDVIGEATVRCTIRKRNRDITFKIIKENASAILGWKSCEELGLVKKMNEIKTNAFNGLGCLQNFEYDIDLIDNPKFENFPARRIPHAIRQQVKDELDAMVKINVIRKMENEVSPVVSPLVIVRQKNKLRICLDPSEVNKNIQRRYYPMKSIEEIAARVHGSKYFTLLDCRRGFWQIKVTKRTEQYLTFSTPWGRYCFQRMPFGLASAPEVFTEIMNRLLDGIERTEVSMDDMLIHAPTLEELQNTTKKVINKLQECGLKLNREKCQFEKQKIKFLGHIFTTNGIEADPEKVDAINRIQQPQDKKQLQRFLGMVNYMGKFIPRQADLTVNLRKLTHKDAEFIWQPEHNGEFIKLKEVLTNSPVLKYYDVNAEVKLSVDASSYAVGAVLLQNDQPIAYASAALTSAQKNYPQIEKEATAIRYGCKKFHEYVYGKKLTIETDHKPLEIIFKKPLHTAPARLQRILFDVTQYHPVIEYKKGSQLFVADSLSRDCSQNNAINAEPDMEIEVHIVMAMSKRVKNIFVDATKDDKELSQLQQIIQDGWPNEIRHVPNELRPYWTFREELSTYNGLVFKGDKVIVPKSQQNETLGQIHQGHSGIQSSIRRARSTLYWINMSKSIADYVNKCQICQSNRPSETKEPMIIKTVPKLPWEIVASDIFKFGKDEYLLICDSYSGFFDVEVLRNLTSAEVIRHMKKWFAIHGSPKTLETDGGTQYSSAEFQQFANKWGFERQVSSPTYPKSNGLAERYVQIAKNMLKKCKMDGSDIYLALLNQRNIPRSDNIPSPNARLMSRTTRSPLPIAEKNLQPKVVKGVTENLTEARKIQKSYADRQSKEAPNINVGDTVRLQQGHRKWTPAKVVKTTEHPRSFIVERADGSQLRRNTIHIRPTQANISPKDTTAVVPLNKNKEVNGNQQNSSDTDTDLPKNADVKDHHEVIPENTVPTNINCTAKTSRYGRVIKPPNRYGYDD